MSRWSIRLQAIGVLVLATVATGLAASDIDDFMSGAAKNCVACDLAGLTDAQTEGAKFAGTIMPDGRRSE